MSESVRRRGATALTSAIRLSFVSFVVALLALTFTLASPSPADAAVENLAGCTASSLPANDDGSSAAVPLPFSPNFFGQTYQQIYVNNNGNVTFDGSLSQYTANSLLSTSRVIIAPFWADVDTRGESNVVTYGGTQFNNRPAFCVNWVNVGYYSGHTDKTNSFQLILVDRSDVGAGDFDIIMNFDRIQWETGDASDGNNGLGGNSARMGYSNGSDQAFEYPGSAVNGAFLDSTPTGLARNSLNSTVTGRYIFNVRGGAPPGGGSITGTVYGPPDNARVGASGNLVPLEGATITACAMPPCSSSVTNANGEFTVAGLNPGDYRLIAYPPPGRDTLLPADASTSVGPSSLSIGETGIAGGTADVGQLTMEEADPPPSGTMLDSIGQIGGAPVLDWGRPTAFSISGCEGGLGSWTVTGTDGVLASGNFSQSEPGEYTTFIPPLSPYHGPVTISTSITNCPDPNDNSNSSFSAYIDPSGNVETTQGAPIAGATVTLYRSDSETGPFSAVPNGSAIMSPSNRTNPDDTDSEGFFHWDTIPGYYIVRAEAAGCHAPGNAGQFYNETAVLPVPPPQLNLLIELECDGGGGGQEVDWADVNCSGGGPNPIDSLLILREDAGLSSLAVQGNDGCPALGASVLVDLVLRIWGDVDCSNTLNPIDALKVLRYDAGLSAPKVDLSCPDMGATVNLGGGETNPPTQQPTATPTPTPTLAPTTAPPTGGPTVPVNPVTECPGSFDPIPIPDADEVGGTDGVTLFFNDLVGGTITDLDICVNVDHAWVGDLLIELEHMNTGTIITLIDQPGVPASVFGCGGDDIRTRLADEAAGAVENQCAGETPTIEGAFRPNDPLSAFDGENYSGNWQIRFYDVEGDETFVGSVIGATLYHEE